MLSVFRAANAADRVLEPSGLVAWWPAEGVAPDAVGTNTNGRRSTPTDGAGYERFEPPRRRGTEEEG